MYYAKRTGPAVEDDVRLPLWSIDRRDLRSGRTETLVTNQGSAMRPVLSPDGSDLLMRCARTARRACACATSASGDDRMLAYPIQHDAQESVPTRDLVPRYDFTPDGAAIILTRNGGLHATRVATGAMQPIPFRAQVELELGPLLRQSLAEESGPVRARLIQEPRQSPDGKQLAFSALGRIHVMDLRSGAVAAGCSHATDPRLSSCVVCGRTLDRVRHLDGSRRRRCLGRAMQRRATRRRLTSTTAFYSDVAFTPEGDGLMALRSSAHDRRQTIQEPMWTGRSGGFLRQAELIEIALGDGAVRVVTSGLIGGAPQFTRDRSVVHLNTEAGLEARPP